MTEISNTITPKELLETITSLPEVPALYPADMDMQDRLAAILDDRDARAHVNRVLIYSIEGAEGVDALLEGNLKVHEVCRVLDGDMQLIEMDTDTTTDVDNARGAAFGMMAAEESTGLIIATAIGRQEADLKDFWNTTTPNVAALLGVMVSCAQAKIPVIAEGEAAFLAADTLAAIRPDMMPYVFVCEAAEEGGPGYAASMLAAFMLSLDDAEDIEADSQE